MTADIHAEKILDPRLRLAVHPAHRPAAPRAGRLLRDPPLHRVRRRPSGPARPRGVVLSGGAGVASPPRGARAPTGRSRSWACRCWASATGCSSWPTSWAARSAGPLTASTGRPPSTSRRSSPLFQGLPARLDVWMSHGDRVEAIPPGFEPVASTASAPFAAVEDARRRFYAVQFHPEVVHTPRGKEVLWNFAHGVCGCSGTWSMRAYVEVAVEQIRAQVGDGHVICALSGGVDSAVAAPARAPGHRRPAALHLRGQRRAARRRAPAGRGGLRPGCSTCRSSPWTPRPASSPGWPGSPTRSRSARSSGASSSPSSRRRWSGSPRTASGPASWSRGRSTRTSSSRSRSRGRPPPSRATTTWAACPR